LQAIVVEDNKLVWKSVADPVCGAGEVRIRVAATAINRADLVQRSGGYPPPPGASPILGLECAGEVVEIGAGVTRVECGDQVCALLAGGGYAEQVVAPAGQVLKIPEGLSAVQAASIPEVFATAYLNLYMEANLQAREKVLVHAGASGVGTAAIQMLKMSGNPVFVTAGSARKVAECVALGADGGFDRHSGSFLAEVQKWAQSDGMLGEGVDVILDPVGAGYLADNISCLGLGGRLVLIGLMSGATAELNLAQMMMKRLRIIGSTLRARPIPQKAAVMDALYSNIWPHFVTGAIKPIIEAQWPIQEADAAHKQVAGNETIGKVVLTVA
jgi:putative PIG3 family NAD(P)H quinone oxidoreductase